MSKDRKTPDFIGPGDNPELDRVLHRLRYDSGLYGPNEYDVFGQKRRAPKTGGNEGDAEPEETTTAMGPPVAPVVREATARPTRRMQWKIGGSILAVIAALAPVAVYAVATQRNEINAAASASAAASMAPSVTATAIASTTATVEPAATAAPASSPSGTTTATVPPSAPAATMQAPAGEPQRPRPRGKPAGVPPTTPSAPSSTPPEPPPAPKFFE